MNVNSISNGAASSVSYGTRPQRPDPAKMAEDLFSKLDSKNQGYLEKSDLESALSKIGTSSGSAGSSSAEQMFAKLDGDGDGKVTKQEMSATFEQMASQLDGPFPRMRLQGQGDAPPPRQDNGKVDEGFTKDQLSAMAEDSQSSDSQLSDLFGQLASNFDVADSNGDGKITHDEAMAYQQANSSKAGDQTSSASTGSSDSQFMKQMLDLLHAYGDSADPAESSLISTSA